MARRLDGRARSDEGMGHSRRAARAYPRLPAGRREVDPPPARRSLGERAATMQRPPAHKTMETQPDGAAPMRRAPGVGAGRPRPRRSTQLSNWKRQQIAGWLVLMPA